MLRFVFGRAGSGKTRTVRLALREMAQAGGDRLMLVVPEQASFENERAMLRLLGPEKARRVSVTSFSRLVDAVQRRYGGFAGRRLDDGGRGVFMSLAIEQVRDRLEIYRKNAESTELVGLMLSISAELKMCAVGPEQLEKAADRLQQGTLRRKLREISLILSAYDALVARSFLDPLDDLTRLKNMLARRDFFSGWTVMVDSFQSFTVQEYEILALMMRQADEVRVALCANGLGGPEDDSGLFALARRTAKTLMRLAARDGVRVAPPQVLEPGRRFRNPALAALEAGAYRPARDVYSGPSGGVAVYEAKNRYDEAAFVCAAIRNLVIQKHYRYRDFAVIARSAEPYAGILDTALGRWEIPYFMDRPEPVDAEPLMRLILSAFRIVRYGFRSDDIFLYLKTGLAGLSTEQISELENYAFVWNLSGKKWREAWTDHPEGFGEKFTEADSALLARVNDFRRRTVGPLARLAEATAGEKTGEEMAAAAYRLLEEVGAAENLRAFAARLARQGGAAAAERELRVWDLLMNALDQTALVIGKTRVTGARYAELLRLVIQSGSIASIPQGLDEVTVGDADRIRTAEPKVVFLIGAARGEFPLAPGGRCVFSDGERRRLIRLGLPLNDTAEGAALQERFLAYASLCAPSERLYITYPVSDGAGNGLSPSSIPGEARAVLKNVRFLNEYALEPVWFACARAPALELTARKWNSGDALSSSLKALFRKREEDGRLAAAARAADREPVRFADRVAARALFGTSLRVSATQIEKFYLCRFQYFCRYGLNVRERRAAELNALEYGSLMHFLLQRLFRDVGARAVDAMGPDELRERILGFLGEYVKQAFGGLENRTPRFAYLVGRIADAARVVAAHIARELCQSAFRPVDFELEIGGAVGPLRIPLPEGGEVLVDGKIDRVDLMDRGGVRYLRVVDYKTGRKEFKLSDVIYGMNMQMLIYLAALCENGGKRYGDFRPAGVLYAPANRPAVSAGRDAPPAALREKAERQLRMDGLVLDDPQVVAGMDGGGRGRFIPVALKDGVPDRRDHVVSPEELKAVLGYLKTLIADMARELWNGEVGAVPLNGDRYNACEWCPYSSVCGHERDDPERAMQTWDRAAAMEELEKAKEEAEP